MKKDFKTLGLTLALAVLSTSAFAGLLPEGSFKGKSSLIKNSLIKNDVMALLIKEDPTNQNRFFAVLAEYDRVPGTNITRKTALTKWIPRIYAYQIDKVTDMKFSMKHLMVDPSGKIVANKNRKADILELSQAENLNGATLTRFKKDAYTETEETIVFKGRVGSTWEDLVPGNYFGTDVNTGGDYFSKAINTEVTNDGVVKFNRDEIQGEFQMNETAPGLFSFESLSNENKGVSKLKNKIGVFIDIVNWKPLMTTDELLIIDPDDATKIGFYYEKH